MSSLVEWVGNRLREPSTRVALGVGVYALQQLISHPPANAQDWLGLCVAVFGAVGGVVTKAPGAADNPQAVPLAVQTIH